MMPDAQAGLDPSVFSVVKDDVDALKRQVYNQDKGGVSGRRWCLRALVIRSLSRRRPGLGGPCLRRSRTNSDDVRWKETNMNGTDTRPESTVWWAKWRIRGFEQEGGV